MRKFIIHKDNSNITAIVPEDRMREGFYKKKKEHDDFYWKTHGVGKSRWTLLFLVAIWTFNLFISENWVKYVAAIAVPLFTGLLINEWQKYLNRDKLKQKYEERDFSGEFVDELFH